MFRESKNTALVDTGIDSFDTYHGQSYIYIYRLTESLRRQDDSLMTNSVLTPANKS